MRKFAQILGRPITLVVIVVMLCIDLAAIPSGQFHHSTMRRAVMGSARASPVHQPILHPPIYRRADGLVGASQPDEDLDTREHVRAGVYVAHPTYRGLLHLTRRTDRVILLDSTLSASEKREYAVLSVAWLEARASEHPAFDRALSVLPNPSSTQTVSNTDTTLTRHTPLPFGVWRNAITIAVAATGLLSLALNLRRLPSRIRAVRAGARLRAGRCPACAYDLAGATSRTPTCPECGRQA